MTSVGQFVRVANNRLGIGKVVGAASDSVEVEYFDSVGPKAPAPGDSEGVAGRACPDQLAASMLLARRWRLAGRTGCSGRVRANTVSGLRTPILISACLKPICLSDGPCQSTTQSRCSSPAATSLRTSTSAGPRSCRPWSSNAAASRGMHGVLSSVVELYDHQLEVVATRPRGPDAALPPCRRGWAR